MEGSPPCSPAATSSTSAACPTPPPRNFAFARRFPRRRVPFLVFAVVFLLWTLSVVLANPADAFVLPVVFAPPALLAYFGYWRRFRAEVGGFAMLEAFLIGAVPAAIAVMVLEIGVLAATPMGFGPAIPVPIGAAVAGPPFNTAAEASSAASPASSITLAGVVAPAPLVPAPPSKVNIPLSLLQAAINGPSISSIPCCTPSSVTSSILSLGVKASSNPSLKSFFIPSISLL